MRSTLYSLAGLLLALACALRAQNIGTWESEDITYVYEIANSSPPVIPSEVLRYEHATGRFIKPLSIPAGQRLLVTAGSEILLISHTGVSHYHAVTGQTTSLAQFPDTGTTESASVHHNRYLAVVREIGGKRQLVVVDTHHGQITATLPATHQAIASAGSHNRFYLIRDAEPSTLYRTELNASGGLSAAQARPQASPYLKSDTMQTLVGLKSGLLLMPEGDVIDPETGIHHGSVPNYGNTHVLELPQNRGYAVTYRSGAGNWHHAFYSSVFRRLYNQDYSHVFYGGAGAFINVEGGILRLFIDDYPTKRIDSFRLSYAEIGEPYTPEGPNSHYRIPITPRECRIINGVAYLFAGPESSGKYRRGIIRWSLSNQRYLDLLPTHWSPGDSFIAHNGLLAFRDDGAQGTAYTINAQGQMQQLFPANISQRLNSLVAVGNHYVARLNKHAFNIMSGAQLVSLNQQGQIIAILEDAHFVSTNPIALDGNTVVFGASQKLYQVSISAQGTFGTPVEISNTSAANHLTLGQNYFADGSGNVFARSNSAFIANTGSGKHAWMGDTLFTLAFRQGGSVLRSWHPHSGDGPSVDLPGTALCLATEGDRVLAITSEGGFGSSAGNIILTLADPQLNILYQTPEALSAPQVTLAEITGTGQLNLAWNPVAGAQNYEIKIFHYDKRIPDIHTVPASQTSLTLSAHGLWYVQSYGLLAYTDQHWGPSASGSFKVYYDWDNMPQASSLHAEATSDSLKLSWSPVPGAQRYYVVLSSPYGGSEAIETTDLQVTFGNLLPGLSYSAYYWAEGYGNFGLSSDVHTFKTPGTQPYNPASFLPHAGTNSQGWRESSWFGQFFNKDEWNGWFHHRHLGWFYPSGFASDQGWCYSQNWGWLWISEGSFPIFYSHSRASWVYYLTWSENPRWLYLFSTDTWIQD